jgi:hypothetical protein
MRYYTEIEQANPTTAGSISDEFTVTIIEKAYDPCNDSALASASVATPIGYAWSDGMTDNQLYVDVTPTTYTSDLASCPITTTLEIQDPSSGDWNTLTQENRLEYPFVFNLASTSLVTIYTVPDQLENDYMKKYLSGDDLVVSARWSHCEDTWVEADSDCVKEAFTFTFSFELGDVCATNQISLGQNTYEQQYPIALDGTNPTLLEIPRGAVASSFSRCALETNVEVQVDKETDEWILLENSPYYSSGAVEYLRTHNYLSVDMSLDQFIQVQTALGLEDGLISAFFRFVTTNADTVDDQVVRDPFYVQFRGPAMCAQNMLDLTSGADLIRKYTVAFTVGSAAP